MQEKFTPKGPGYNGGIKIKKDKKYYKKAMKKVDFCQ